MFDIIGDIHGHADELVELLETLGYRDDGGIFRHRQRRAIFCGDFIDRGPRIRDTLTICRSMCQNDAALAVIGNHEFNALAWHEPDPVNANRFLRQHSDKNRKQFRATIEQLSEVELSAALEWFRTLPLTLDLGSLRIVHACWSDTDIAMLAEATQQLGHLSPMFLARATTPGDNVFDALECTLKGPEMRLPNGLKLPDREGHPRANVRVRWFIGLSDEAFQDWTFPPISDAAIAALPFNGRPRVMPYPDDAPPVFFGHYWLPSGTPRLQRHNVCCLDYSVARRGQLVAYRFDGEQVLSPDRFVAVTANS